MKRMIKSHFKARVKPRVVVIFILLALFVIAPVGSTLAYEFIDFEGAKQDETTAAEEPEAAEPDESLTDDEPEDEVFDAVSVLSSVKTKGDPEEAAQLEKAVNALRNEYDAQGLSYDFVKIQMFYLFTAFGKVGGSDVLYNAFVSCFAEGDDYAALARIEELMGASFTDYEKYTMVWHANEAANPQNLPPASIHIYIGRLAESDDTIFAEGAFSGPIHSGDLRALVTSEYDMRTDPVTGEFRAHTGLDLGVPNGTPVYPVKSGKVIMVESSETGYGNYIVISHGNGFASLYAHLSTIAVEKGQYVSTDTVIADSGNTGRSTGPHLHFEIIKNGSPENPKKFLPLVFLFENEGEGENGSDNGDNARARKPLNKRAIEALVYGR